MKTFLIFKREGDLLGAKLGSYQALEKDDTSANRSYLMAEPMAAHLEVPEGADPDCCIIEDGILVEDAGLVSDKASAMAAASIRATLVWAKNIGEEIMSDFTIENMQLGITNDNMTGAVLEAMSKVIIAMQTGSLKEAINAARAIPAENKDVKYITDARLLSFVNKIEEKLGMPISTEL